MMTEDVSGHPDGGPRYPDLRSAGRALAESLGAFEGKAGVVVLAPVLGGVPVASEVSRLLRAPLDYVVVRRLLAPGGPGSQICAVSVCGATVLDEELTENPPEPSSPLGLYVSDALEKLALRERICRGGRPAAGLTGKTAVLVDCGVATGMTLAAAIRAVRRAGAARVVAAVPVASREGGRVIESAADEFVCLARPEPFGHVGLWYADFRRPSDEQAAAFL
jgi:putative phosphoribosyl transferase